MISDIQIRQLTTEHAFEAEQLTREIHMSMSPMYGPLKLPPSDFNAWSAIRVCVDSGFSLAAFDGNTIVGLELAYVRKRDESAPLFQPSNDDITTRTSLYYKSKGSEMASALEQRLSIFDYYKVDAALHLYRLIIVERCQNRGLATRMTHLAINKAASAGIQCFFTRASSLYASNIYEKLGFEKLAEMRYDEFVGEDGEPVFKPPEPHMSMVLWSKLYSKQNDS